MRDFSIMMPGVASYSYIFKLYVIMLTIVITSCIRIYVYSYIIIVHACSMQHAWVYIVYASTYNYAQYNYSSSSF